MSLLDAVPTSSPAPSPGAGSDAGSQAVAAAKALAPAVEAGAEEIERTGRIPDAVVHALTEHGLYRLYAPADTGGPEADPVSALLAMEVLARADPSVAWCAQVSSANAWQLATLAPGTVEAMDHGAGARRFSGSARPLGIATRVDGGYRVSGRWDFASNCLHAQWYCGACIAEEDGRRRVRAVFMPMSEGTIIDTWQVAGLRGTGSHDFAVQDVFVPDERVAAGRHIAAQPGRLYHQRLTMVVNWALTAGVGLGIARGALDAFGAMSSQATAGTVDTALRDRPTVQATVGRAEATLGAARAYCLQSIGGVWQGSDDPAEFDRLVLDARLSIVHALQSAVEVVNLLFQAGGTRSVFNRHRLERFFRDAHVAAQHGAALPSHYEAAGRLSLGLPAAAPFW